MLLYCNNKGCNQSGEHKLNKETNEVICEHCGKPITNITEMMKRTLKSSGQVINTNNKKAFMMACSNCQANREVVWNESTNMTCCKVCGNEIKVHAAMKQALIEIYKLNKKEE
jgi:ribosomal protein S27E